MIKRISALLLTAALTFGLAGLALAAGTEAGELEPQTETIEVAIPVEGGATAEVVAVLEAETPAPEEAAVDSRFYLNGEALPEMPVAVLDGVGYCSLKVFFEKALASAEVTWVNDRAEVAGTTAAGESLSLTAKPGNTYIEANGRCLYVPTGVKLEDGVTMVPISVLEKVFQGSESHYDAALDAVVMTTGSALLTSGSNFYDAQSLDLMSRVISCEAGNESLLGQIALGSLILNRVASKECPNTVYGVLYQPKQFNVVYFSSFQKTPRAISVVAAKLALEGVNPVPGALFYNVKGMNSWAARNRSYVGTIGNHDFYK